MIGIADLSLLLRIFRRDKFVHSFGFTKSNRIGFG